MVAPSSTPRFANATLQLYDFVARRFVTVGSMPLTDVDLRRKLELPDPGVYLRGSDGHVRARIVSRSTGSPHHLRVDALRVEGAQ